MKQPEFLKSGFKVTIRQTLHFEQMERENFLHNRLGWMSRGTKSGLGVTVAATGVGTTCGACILSLPYWLVSSLQRLYETGSTVTLSFFSEEEMEAQRY